MKLELNISQIFIEYFAVLTKENWLCFLMVSKENSKDTKNELDKALIQWEYFQKKPQWNGNIKDNNQLLKLTTENRNWK
jgi:hypothetical protein